MIILVIWDGVRKRDVSQKLIYDEINKNHQVIFTTPDKINNNILNKINYDIIWLDIYHCVLDINWEKLITINKPIIFDIADNEYYTNKMLKKTEIVSKIKRGIICSRYLPNTSINDYSKLVGHPVKQLTWLVNDNIIKPEWKINKDIDVSYICTINTPFRKLVQKKIDKIGEHNNLKVITGGYYGDEYYQMLCRSKVFIIISERSALTQKYFEASVCGCTIVGDKPTYPNNNIVVYDFKHDLSDLENTILKAIKHPQINKFKSNFWNEFNEIIKTVTK